MDAAAQKTTESRTAKAEPAPRAEAPHAEAVEVWAFLGPTPSCDTELIIFPDQTGEWVECPSCGLQLRAPEVIPGKAETLYPKQRPAPRRKARVSADEVAWLALQAAEKGDGPSEPKPPADDPTASARDALAREVARVSAAGTQPEATEPDEPAAPEVTHAADALDALAHRSRGEAETPPDAPEEPPAPQGPPELTFHDESAPLPESRLRETPAVPRDSEPMAEPVTREERVLEARPVTRPPRAARRALAARPNAPWEIGSPEDSGAASLDLPTPAARSPLGRPARQFRSDLVVVWVVAVLTAAGVGFLAWAIGLPDLAAGSILAIGVAVLWTFFGRGSGQAAPPAGPS